MLFRDLVRVFLPWNTPPWDIDEVWLRCLVLFEPLKKVQCSLRRGTTQAIVTRDTSGWLQLPRREFLLICSRFRVFAIKEVVTLLDNEEQCSDIFRAIRKCSSVESPGSLKFSMLGWNHENKSRNLILAGLASCIPWPGVWKRQPCAKSYGFIECTNDRNFLSDARP